MMDGKKRSIITKQEMVNYFNGVVPALNFSDLNLSAKEIISSSHSFFLECYGIEV